MVLDPALIGFRPLAIDDLQLLHRWFAQSHVATWYRDEADLSYDEVVAQYAPSIRGEEPVHGFIITYDGRPIGQIQTYRIAAYPTYRGHIDIVDGMAGVDLLIGDPDYVHQGLGSHILRRFLREIVFGTYGATSCLIDPEVDNTVAIRCYEKAGFRHLTTVQLSPDGPRLYLMRIERAAVAADPVSGH
ncbi:MAG TPA: GNAT family N-acetyltransferase [Chloroflexota bacterium]|nr:GNAT family N-acetyltransferase [Chloroflexota bacterium]